MTPIKLIQRIANFSLMLTLSMPAFAAHEEHPDHEPLELNEALTFAGVLNAAVENAPQAMEDAVRAQQAEDYQAAGSGWLSGRPVLNFSLYDDRLTESQGLREQEFSLQLPLWRPGQRKSAGQQGQRYQQQYETWQTALRWQLAGEVRMVLNSIEQAQQLLELEQEATALSQQLLDTTEMMQRAGAVAQLDVLQARNLLLDQQQRELEAEAGLVDAERTYQVLTGLSERPAKPLREMLNDSEEIPDNHPMLAYLNSDVELAESAVQQSEHTAKGNPQLSIGTRRERPDNFQPYLDSVALSLSIPIGGKSIVAARSSDARRQQVDAEVSLLQYRRLLQQQLHEAEHELYVTRQALPLAQQQAEIAAQRSSMARSAYSAGELTFNQVLSALEDARAGSRAYTLLQIREQHLISEFNQYTGVLP